MKPMTIIRITLAVVIAVPIIALNVGALSLSAATDEALNSVDGTTPPAGGLRSGLAGIGRKLIGIRGEVIADTRQRDTFDINSYSARHTFSVSRVLPITAFLQPDEDAPMPEQELLWATARAPRLMMDGCTLPLDTIARGCAYGSSEITRDHDSGDIRLTGELHLLPLDAPGDLTDTHDWEMETYATTLPRDRTFLTRIDPLDLPAARIDLMRAARAECDTLRAQKGTCVITNVTLGEQANSDGTYQLRARASMAWLRASEASEDTAAVAAAGERLDESLARYGQGPDEQSLANNVVITNGGKALSGGRALKPGQNRHFQKVDVSQ